MLSQDLSRTKRVDVVERRRIGALLTEIALAGSGRVDTLTAPRAGRIVGARRVAAGALTQSVGGKYRAALQVVDVANGVRSAEIAADIALDDVSRGEAELLQQLMSALALGTEEFLRVGASFRPAIPVEAVVQFGNGVAALASGDLAGGKRALTAASQLAPTFAAATTVLNAPEVANGKGELDRRARVKQMALTVNPVTTVRTAEAVDAASGSLVRRLLLGLVVVLP
jgi:hypothetical protein